MPADRSTPPPSPGSADGRALCDGGCEQKALAQALSLIRQLPRPRLRGAVARNECSYVLAGVVGKLSLGRPHPLYAERASQTNTQSLLTKI